MSSEPAPAPAPSIRTVIERAIREFVTHVDPLGNLSEVLCFKHETGSRPVVRNIHAEFGFEHGYYATWLFLFQSVGENKDWSATIASDGSARFSCFVRPRKPSLDEASGDHHNAHWRQHATWSAARDALKTLTDNSPSRMCFVATGQSNTILLLSASLYSQVWLQLSYFAIARAKVSITDESDEETTSYVCAAELVDVENGNDDDNVG